MHRRPSEGRSPRRRGAWVVVEEEHGRAALPVVPIVLSLLVSAAAISSESFWIDEAGSAVHAMQGSLPDLWRSMAAEANSNMQLLSYHVYLWFWEKAFGHSEIALRSANVPLLVFCVLAWSWALAGDRQVRWAALVAFLFSPFVWIYLNEARPYVMVLSGACLLLAPIIRLLQAPEPRRVVTKSMWVVSTCGVLLLASTSALAVPWIVLWTLCLWMLVGKDMPLTWLRQSPLSLVACASGVALLGAYYYWTLQQGFGTSPGRNTLPSAAFAFYEHLGFSGLGPGRNALRESPLALLQLPYPLLLVGHATVLATFSALLLPRLRERVRQNPAVALAAVLLVAPASLVFLLGAMNETRILGRHIAPLTLLVSAFVAWGAVDLWRVGGPRRAAAVLVFASLVVSCAMLRLSDAHQKDDYRGASRIARDTVADGGGVLWAADALAAVYYGLVPLSQSRGGSESVTVVTAGARGFSFEPPPNAEYRLVVLSKPDIYDVEGTLAGWLTAHRYRQVGTLQAFTLWGPP
jgi:hypothetical protein